MYSCRNQLSGCVCRSSSKNAAEIRVHASQENQRFPFGVLNTSTAAWHR
jgi:hypothetical protein